MTDVRFAFLDTETASLQGGVCDIAIALVDKDLNVLWENESLIDPERPINPAASGIHHITDDMVWDAPTLAEYMQMTGYPLDHPNLVVGGHNVQFDCRMLAEALPEQYTKLCTLKLARNLHPDLSDHKLQTIRYSFKLSAGTAHRAMGDVVTCISFARMLCDEKQTDLLGLLELCKVPLSLDSRFPFGKHKGDRLRDLPVSYVRWLLEKTELDPDLREALTLRLT
jgi:exodeoxyribonuclease X